LKSVEELVVAIDLGTTTIAASLLERSSGRRLAVTGGLNPQRQWGADVVARLAAATAADEKLQGMRSSVNQALEQSVVGLLAAAAADPAQLQAIAIAGNPTMEHLLLGLPVESLAFPPFRPLFSAGKSLSTSELGWNLAAPVYLAPLPGGFVGGDLVAFLYGVAASPGETMSLPRLFLDLGTNGEIALFSGGKAYATSAAAGPAFEGGNLTCGMAALPGGINEVRIEGSRVKTSVIGGGTPLGICGSGVIGAIAALLEAGVIDPGGRLLAPDEITSNLGNNIITIAGVPAFSLYRDARSSIFLTQEDIRQVQLAKGAIRGGMEVLLSRAGVSEADLVEVVLTGSFGAVLSPEHLKSIGVFTDNMVKNTRFIHEGVLAGAERVLCRADGLAGLEHLAASLKVIPLSGTPLFEKHFLSHLDFSR
jgi:uncharacterized 2Fe-2S/4Fe-4S cluster protein (DUF4445 family)